MKRHRLVTCLVLLAVASTGVIVACSSDDKSSGSSGTSGTAATTTTVHVSAAAGGSVADPSGKTKLDIPAGALEKDTDITLAIKPSSAGSVVEVSEFGPDGLKFLKPVALTIKADAALATTGKTLALAVLEGGAFKAIEGSTYANGAATASIMHFSSYSIVLIDGKAILQPPASCTDAINNFKACGGDIKGTWTFADFCIPGGAIGNDPFKGKCPGFVATGDITITGDVTIDATTIATAAGQQKTTATLTIPLTCANTDGDGGTIDGGPMDCAALQTKLNPDATKPQYSCTDKGSGVCACTATETKSTAAKTDTYTTSGNTLQTTDSTGKLNDPVEYCVDNNLLTVRGTKDGGTSLVYVLNRK